MFGISPITILNMLIGGGGAPASQVAQPGPSQRPPVDDRMGKFVSTILADTEDVWKDPFTKGGATYKELRLVLFRNQTSARNCGAGHAATGPFYCPADQKNYIKLAFYETLTKRPGAPGDDALAQSNGGAIVPESFTHGSSAQRQRWFDNGLKNGSVKACDTFWLKTSESR